MARLFNRDIVITIGTKRIATRMPGDSDIIKSTLRVSFKIEKNRSQEPNRAELRIWNLNKKNRAAFQQERPLPVIIEAGYVDETQELFNGDLGNTNDEKNGLDWITTMEVADGQHKYRSSRISESFGSGTQVIDVIKTVAERMGLGMGNVSKKLDEGNLRNGITEFKRGISVVGKCADVLAKLLASAGFSYSIQNGQLQLLRINTMETIDDETIFLDMASGMIGTPEIGEKGTVKVRSLLQGAIIPGREVEVLPLNQETMRIRTEKVTHIGDSWGADWYSDIEGKLI